MGAGNIDIVRYFHKKGTNFTTNAIALAAGKGALDCLQYAMNFQNVASYGHGIFLEAIRNGRMESILFLQEKGFTLHLNCYYDNRNSKMQRVDLAEIAASSGQCDILKYLHSQGCSLSWVATAAAEAGHWDCLEYAIENGALLRSEYRSMGTLTIAQRLAHARLLKLFPLALSRAGAIDERTSLNFAKMKKWELFQLCIQYITQTSLSLIFVAVEQGYIECLQRLYELSVSEVEASGNGLNWLTCAASHSTSSGLSLMDLALSAATANYWECLTFLITHGFPMPKSLTAVLAKAGQQELYLLATDRGCEVSVQAACYFARDGNLDLLQHALMHRCERSEEILKAAARHGQLQCLMYAHAQGCPWSAEVTMAAARGDHRECLQYLYEHGCPSNERVRSILRKQSNLG